MNDTKFSFLHKRPFWSLIIGISIITYSWLYGWQLFGPYRDISDTIDILNYTFGGALWGGVGFKLGGLVGHYILSIIYLLVLIYLLIQTFKKATVPIKYPLSFLGLTLFGYLFLISVYGY